MRNKPAIFRLDLLIEDLETVYDLLRGLHILAFGNVLVKQETEQTERCIRRNSIGSVL